MTAVPAVRRAALGRSASATAPPAPSPPTSPATPAPSTALLVGAAADVAGAGRRDRRAAARRHADRGRRRDADAGRARDHVTARAAGSSERVRVVDVPRRGRAGRRGHRRRADDRHRRRDPRRAGAAWPSTSAAAGCSASPVAARPFLAGGAGEELDRQGALFGVGTDLVLRNMPPVRVHRLRFTAGRRRRWPSAWRRASAPAASR